MIDVEAINAEAITLLILGSRSIIKVVVIDN